MRCAPGRPTTGAGGARRRAARCPCWRRATSARSQACGGVGGCGHGHRRPRRRRRRGAGGVAPTPGVVRAPRRPVRAASGGRRWRGTGSPAGSRGFDDFYPGQPLLVTANDYDLKVFNGDIGVVIATRRRPGGGIERGGSPLLVRAQRVRRRADRVCDDDSPQPGQPVRAVSVILPDSGSPLLTRELLYTAITRARSRCASSGRGGGRRCGEPAGPAGIGPSDGRPGPGVRAPRGPQIASTGGAYADDARYPPPKGTQVTVS